MSTDFYAAVLPATGPYCALSIHGSNKAATVVPSYHNTIEELIAQGAKIAKQQRNAYFLPGSLIEPTNRQAANVRSLRSFFVDVDCGEGKPYQIQAEGLDALNKFVQDVGLPKPWIVNSGHGLHAYWPFHEEISGDDWQPYAKAFKELVLSHMSVDPTVTADRARVLRMPDTINAKADREVMPVLLIQQGDISPLATLTDKLPASITEARQYGMDGFTKSNDTYPLTNFTRIVRRSLGGTGCAQIAHAVTEAATLPEPLWRAALSIAWRCEDAETSIHKISKAHPGYDFDATVEKASKTVGPMTCRWYRENNSSLCADCEHNISSPIQLGRKVLEAPDPEPVSDPDPDAVPAPPTAPASAAIQIPKYPWPYFRGLHGGVFVRVKDKANVSKEEMIYPYDLYITKRFFDLDAQGEGEGEMVSLHLHTPMDGVRQFVVPATTLLVKERVRDALIKQGVVALSKELEGIMAYLAKFLKELQRNVSADRTHAQLGWTADNSGFVIGEREYRATGVRYAPPSGATRTFAGNVMDPTGKLSVWSEIANFYNRPGLELHALGLFFGFGAPLLKLIGGLEVRGATVNLMSQQSGIGKTTVQFLVNSIFGHPSVMMLKKTDTGMSKWQFIGALNTIAATMDEVTGMTDEAVSEMIYDVPEGRGRHRMEASSNKLRVNTVSWSTIVMTSSNSSLYDKLSRLKNAADGEVRRLIELRLTRPEDITKIDSDAIFRKLAQNYGVAGPPFIQYVLNNMEAVVERLNSWRSRIDKDLELTQSDRFYSIIFACAFAGGEIARELGLVALDPERIYPHAMEVVRGIRKDVVAPMSDVSAIAQETLMTYINENVNNALVINGIKPKVGHNAPIHSPRVALRMRYEPDTRELWIPATELRKFFTERQVDVVAAMRDLGNRKILKNHGTSEVKRVSAGAIGNFASGSVRCYCVDGAVLDVDATIFDAKQDGS